MIIGVGIDVAEIERFGESIERTPAMLQRLFVEDELILPSGERRGVASLAVRFAAKEALAKALGAPAGLLWTDAEVYVEGAGSPGSGCAGPSPRGRRSWGFGTGTFRSAMTRGSLPRW